MSTAGFVDDVGRALIEGRALAEARMDSTCRIFYLVSRTGTVNGAGVEGETYADRATDVPCRVHPPSAGAESSTPGAALGVQNDRVWSIPVDAVAPHPGDFVKLTSVGSMTDPSLADKTFRIIDIGDASQATARRMRVQVEP